MSKHRAVPTATVSIALMVGYTLGSLGWVWDNLEHLRRVQLGLGAGPAHLLMGIATWLVLAALALAVRRQVGRPLAYGCLFAGLLVSFVHPQAGTLILLPLPLMTVWYFAPGEGPAR